MKGGGKKGELWSDSWGLGLYAWHGFHTDGRAHGWEKALEGLVLSPYCGVIWCNSPNISDWVLVSVSVTLGYWEYKSHQMVRLNIYGVSGFAALIRDVRWENKGPGGCWEQSLEHRKHLRSAGSTWEYGKSHKKWTLFLLAASTDLVMFTTKLS